MRRISLVIALAACKQDVAPPPPPPGPVTPAPVPADAAPVAPLIELLHHTRAVVAVSSTVLNPKIQPDQLVDGKLETAWNSRTGDLAGSWIAFRVPADARVAQVKLTAGFVAKGREGDYFTMNHRIRSIRISHGGKLVANATLDPEVRGLQTIPVAGPGGDYRIEIASVIPGTQKTWRETCVSELEVWGTAPAPVAASTPPTVTIGSLDALAYDPMTGPFPSIASFCEAWAKPIRDASHGAPRCVDHESLAAPAGAFRGARVVELDNGDSFGGNFPCLLLVGTRAGWFATEQVQCTSGEGTNVMFVTDELAVHAGKLVWSYTRDLDVTGDKTHDEITVTCNAGDDGEPLCTSAPTSP